MNQLTLQDGKKTKRKRTKNFAIIVFGKYSDIDVRKELVRLYLYDPNERELRLNL